MERHFSDSHDINVKFTKKVVELERIPRDWREISSFFLLFLSTFRFIIQENLYYIFPNYERNFFLLMFSFFSFHINNKYKIFEYRYAKIDEVLQIKK